MVASLPPVSNAGHCAMINGRRCPNKALQRRTALLAPQLTKKEFIGDDPQVGEARVVNRY
jgi:hypothetical protein